MTSILESKDAYSQVAKNLYLAAHKKDRNSTILLLKEFKGILKSLEGKPLKALGLLKTILKIEWKKEEQRLRYKAQIQAANFYFEKLLYNLENDNTFSNEIFESIKTAIGDLRSPLIDLGRNVIDYSFIHFNTNTQLTTIQFKRAHDLFYFHELPTGINSQYEIDHMVIPFLRTVLESKIKYILGIDIIRSKDGYVDITALLKILSTLNCIDLHKNFDYETILIIMKWLNHYMHRNLRPEPYVIHCVIDYLDPIFAGGERKLNGRVLRSFNMSAFVHDENQFHLLVEQSLQKKYPGCYVEWSRREVATM